MRTLQGQVLACALAAAAAVEAGLAQSPQPTERAASAPAKVIAAKLRIQGYPCRGSLVATHDRRASKPLGAVWNLRCGNANATYRVRLIPDMAARVQRLVVWP